MPEYPQTLREFLDSVGLVTDPTERVNLLLDFADTFREVPPEVARRPFPQEHQVPACESEAYVWALPQPDRTLKLYFAVENPAGVSAKALAAILDRTLSGLAPEEIERISPDIVYEIFRPNISMAKGLGLMAMVQAVKSLARRAKS